MVTEIQVLLIMMWVLITGTKNRLLGLGHENQNLSFDHRDHLNVDHGGQDLNLAHLMKPTTYIPSKGELDLGQG